MREDCHYWQFRKLHDRLLGQGMARSGDQAQLFLYAYHDLNAGLRACAIKQGHIQPEISLQAAG